jgi:hypothetical protein
VHNLRRLLEEARVGGGNDAIANDDGCLEGGPQGAAPLALAQANQGRPSAALDTQGAASGAQPEVPAATRSGSLPAGRTALDGMGSPGPQGPVIGELGSDEKWLSERCMELINRLQFQGRRPAGESLGQ